MAFQTAGRKLILRHSRREPLGLPSIEVTTQEGRRIQMKIRACFVIVSFLSVLVCTAPAQTAAPNSSLISIQVPRLIKFSGVAQDETHKAITGVVGITFSLYEDQQGGSPLWVETQNVRGDASGHYTAMLGSASAEGVPLELFSSGEAQWLGVQIQGQPAQARVLLVSVPYALKAHEAETLSGRSISDFVLVNKTASTPPNASNTTVSSNSTSGSSLPPINNDGPTNFAGTNGTQIVGVTQKGTGAGLSANSTTLAAVRGTITGKSNTALYGLASNTSKGSNAAGVTGQANTETGSGVQGYADGPTGTGVLGVANGTSGVANGVSGQSASPVGGSAGVAGFENAATGQVFGVTGTTSSAGQYSAGVHGSEYATTGQVAGVSGYTVSSGLNAAGVSGFEAATTGQVFGVIGYNVSTGQFAAGVIGNEAATTGQVFGVTGETSSTTDGSAGVSGFEGATTGNVSGVGGTTASSSGNGVTGNATATEGNTNGVYGLSASPNGSGVSGVNNASSGGAGVTGFANATSGAAIGVYGQSASTSGNGVNGNATATSGFTTGVTGTSASPGGVGVQGVNNSGGNGVAGFANAARGLNFGVLGVTASSGGVGVQGGNSSTGGFVALAGSSYEGLVNASAGKNVKFQVDYAGNGFFAGNLNVTGKLTKGSGSFKIDHPLDPANKYLSHSFVESPDMMNMYNGLVTLNTHGSAWITMPDYFEALNRDFRYQLTSIGRPQPSLYIGKELVGNRFKIAGGKPGGKVSWQVTGIRHDAYADAYRIPTEEDKSTAEQGYYLHPEVFGQPASKSIQAVSQKDSATDQLAKVSNP